MPRPEQTAGHVPRLPRHGWRGSRDPRAADGRLRLPSQELSLIERPKIVRHSSIAGTSRDCLENVKVVVRSATAISKA
ncbi:hypothetical protein [Synechococcus sp. UW179A]|uniref:hypothetical protein n=1 Tax=Synechococcus sp. UW179A TaxID=2575510 RepID=UPI0010BE6889|nr:hypothetical protein [Synechococcus sp. UW179A]